MKYFGTDGIRGVPGESLPYDLVDKIGKALHIFNKKNILIGTDTRISKDNMITHLANGITSMGMNVIILGVISTPALIFESRRRNTVAVMITASHNPYKDNGIKITNSGLKLTIDEEKKIEELIDTDLPCVDEKGLIYYDYNSGLDYIDFIKSHIEKSNLKIAIDCANGSVYKLAPIIFNEVTNRLHVLNSNPNGLNINLNCGSTDTKELSKYVIENNCDIGFAFDGDADRVICIDNKGRRIDGDVILFVIAKCLKQINLLTNSSVVLTIMSNLGIIKSLNENGINAIEANVGDKYVIEQMAINNASLGGENSGHIIISNCFHTGDGILTSLILLKALSCLKTTISEEYDSINMYHDKMINIKVLNRNKVMDNIDLFNSVNDIKNKLDNDCKIIIRPSGTEDVIRLSVMAKNLDDVNKYSEILKNIIINI